MPLSGQKVRNRLDTAAFLELLTFWIDGVAHVDTTQTDTPLPCCSECSHLGIVLTTGADTRVRPLASLPSLPSDSAPVCGGWGCVDGSFGIATSAFLIFYNVLPPQGDFTIEQPIDDLGLAVFCAIAVGISVVAERYKWGLRFGID